MTGDRWATIRYVVTMLLAVALAMIPAALAVGLAVRMFVWAAGLP